MARFIPDSATKRYVIISPIRLERPKDTHQSKNQSTHIICPFCPGNESLTPPEVFRIGDQDRWTVRVVPNKYPITDIHEVVILHPSHTDDICALPSDHVRLIMETFYQRYVAHQKNGQVLIFGNHGAHAGASLSHPHAQIVVIPRNIQLDALKREPLANIIEERQYAIAYCPAFSQWPYEVWITPKRSSISFEETTEEERNDLGLLLQHALKTLKKAYESEALLSHNENEPFSYNYYISHETNFFLRIVPRFIHRAGFELSTGLSVNSIHPEEAANTLRSLW